MGYFTVITLPLILQSNLIICGFSSSTQRLMVQTQSTVIANERMTVQLNCNYNLPDGDQIAKIWWLHNDEKVYEYKLVNGGTSPQVLDPSMTGRLRRMGQGVTANVEIVDVRESDAGKWTCNIITASFTDGSSTTDLQIRVMPKISTIYRQPETELDLDQSVTITCVVDSAQDSTPTIFFFQVTDEGKEIQRAASEKTTFTIPAVEITDAGAWYCVARNSIGDDRSMNLRLVVKYKPYVDYSASRSVKLFNASIGSHTRLHCDFKAFPKITTIKWFKKVSEENAFDDWWHIATSAPTRYIEEIVENSEAVLHIKNVGIKDMGLFKCEAFNSLGKGVCEVELAEGEDPSQTSSDFLKEKNSTHRQFPNSLVILCLMYMSKLVVSIP